MNLLTWLKGNATALGIVLAALPLLWAVVQYVLTRRAESKKIRFETYHSLVKQLVDRESPEKPIRLDRQVAVVFELRNFKRYDPVTIRILEGLKKDWSSAEYGPVAEHERLFPEIDLAVAAIRGRLRNRLSWRSLV